MILKISDEYVPIAPKFYPVFLMTDDRDRWQLKTAVSCLRSTKDEDICLACRHINIKKYHLLEKIWKLCNFFPLLLCDYLFHKSLNLRINRRWKNEIRKKLLNKLCQRYDKCYWKIGGKWCHTIMVTKEKIMRHYFFAILPANFSGKS